MTDELTKALLVEDVASQRAIAGALHASLVRRVPFVRALVETGATTPEALGRVLGRAPAPVVQRVVPLAEVVAALPPGLCERLAVVPVRKDAITGTVDVAVADADDAHAIAEIAFHLGAPVRVLRAPLSALEEGLRRAAGMASRPPAAPAPGLVPVPMDAPAPETPRTRARLVIAEDDDDRTSRPPARGTHSLPPSPAAAIAASARPRRDTPPWGTEIPKTVLGSEPPKGGTASDIPIPLTRRTFTAVSGGTQRPPPLVDPAASPLGEGYPLDAASLTPAVEVDERARSPIPPPPRVPGAEAAEPESAAPSTERSADRLGAIAASLPDLRIAVREAATRDEVLDRLLAGAERVAGRVALFVVRRGGYLGWTCNAAFAPREALSAVLLPIDEDNLLDRAVHDGLTLGPVPRDDAHAPLWAVMKQATPDVAVVPVRVLEKAAVIVIADELVDTMIATRHLEDLAGAAGEAFARILRERA